MRKLSSLSRHCLDRVFQKFTVCSWQAYKKLRPQTCPHKPVISDAKHSAACAMPATLGKAATSPSTNARLCPVVLSLQCGKPTLSRILPIVHVLSSKSVKAWKRTVLSHPEWGRCPSSLPDIHSALLGISHFRIHHV